ncbi:GNAT family N-acetyltransferase [Ensifer sp. LC163]|uniref:GNAT family N-acetyltransferase n=1 Tax=Ensifer sp. LC163 TaxID=1120652 RepID=UPI0009F4691F|nr:GNAT family protein [Ensifer sp. LC163]
MPTAPVQLEIFAQHHIADMLDWFPTAAALTQWGGPGLRFPLDATQLEEMQASTSGNEPARWVFSGIVDGNLAGHAQVALDWENGVGRLGRVAINPRLRGLGLAHPFLQCIIERFFADPIFERLELNVYTFNTAAIRTYLKLGFVEEGVRRSSARVGDVRWDTAIYGMLRSDLSAKSLPQNGSPT